MIYQTKQQKIFYEQSDKLCGAKTERCGQNDCSGGKNSPYCDEDRIRNNPESHLINPAKHRMAKFAKSTFNKSSAP